MFLILFSSLFYFFNSAISFPPQIHSIVYNILFLSSFFENDFLLSSVVVRELLSFPWTEFLSMELISQKNFPTSFFLFKLQPICCIVIYSLLLQCLALAWPVTPACQIPIHPSMPISNASLIKISIIWCEW